MVFSLSEMKNYLRVDYDDDDRFAFLNWMGKRKESGGIKRSHVLNEVTLENIELKGDFVDVD